MKQLNVNVLDLAKEKLEENELKNNKPDLEADHSRDRFLTDFGKSFPRTNSTEPITFVATAILSPPISKEKIKISNNPFLI